MCWSMCWSICWTVYTMHTALILVLSAWVSRGGAVSVPFPPGFQFGASTAAYQVEGGWNASDKGENIWDRFTHADPTVISDLSNGDVACDSYHLWRRDVQMAQELGLQFYRISISWTRLLPTGYSNVVSEDGKKYYSDLIDALLEAGIEPIVTLYHFDLPQNLQDLGGWTNPLIVQWFASYARVCYSLWADRVRRWITVNEPSILCDLGYSTGHLAPGTKEPLHAPFLCTKYVLLAHARAWRIYHTQYKPLYHGKVSISSNMVWVSEASLQYSSLTKLALDFTSGRHTHPIYSAAGGWPPTLVRLMEGTSAREGYDSSRLPHLTQKEVQLIRGTFDYFALNYYTCRLARRARPGERVDTLFLHGIPELRAVLDVPPGLAYGTAQFNVHCPSGLRSQLAWIKQQYGDLEVLITENGVSSVNQLQDDDRIHFIRTHLEQVLLAIHKDGVNVTGYTYWSLMDNFEWMDGYLIKFGLYEVDFTSPRRPRTPRASAQYYRDVIRARALDVDSKLAKQFTGPL